MSRHHPRIVAWRSPEDLIEVKNAFYPPSNDPDQRQMALSKVRAWTVRGRLPHAIEATAILTEAVLHDLPETSQLNLRLAYSTAICRFVNGLLDPGQQSQFALPMHTLARNLNLPASFVEIRHAATHEALPSLSVLRTVATRALDWLWVNYWSTVDLANPVGTSTGGERAQLSRARLGLKRWRQLRRDNPLRQLKQGDASPETREAFAIIKECVTICKDEEGRNGLVDAFLEEKALIPAGKKKSPLMGGAVHLWLPLLEAIDPLVNGFASQLLASMLEVFVASYGSQIPLTGSPTEGGYSSEFIEAILKWSQTLTSARTSSRSQIAFGTHSSNPVDLDELVKQCVLRPTEWGIRFLRHLVKEHQHIAQKYAEIVEMASTQVVPLVSSPKVEQKKSTKKSEADSKKRAIEDVEEEIKAFEARFEAMKQQRTEWEARSRNGESVTAVDMMEMEGRQMVGRWRRWSGEWVPRPIGVL